MTYEQVVDSWLQYEEDNVTFSSAVDFYVRAVDNGNSPLLSTLFRRDFYKFIQLIPHFELPPRLRGEWQMLNERDREIVIRKLEQRAIAFDTLVNNHFPHLIPDKKPEGDYPVGCVASVRPNGIIWAYRPMTDEFPDRLILDASELGDPSDNWGRYGIRISTSEGWINTATELPQYLAFRDIQKILKDSIQRTRPVLGSQNARLWEWNTLPLVYERAWYLLYHAPAYVDWTSSRPSYGLYNTFRTFASGDAVRTYRHDNQETVC
jgi:hypothetical protein